jgi:hypothetical protein
MTLREAEDRVCGKTNAQGGKVSRGKNCFFVVDVFEVVKAKQSKAKERKLAIKDAGME